MLKIYRLIIFIFFVFILSSCQSPEVNPFELGIDFKNQDKTWIPMTDNEKRALYQSMKFYEQSIKYESQFLSINSTESLQKPLDLKYSNIILTNYLDTFDFRSFEKLDVNTIGYEQLFDTGGLSGRLKLFLQLLDDFTDTYFTSKIELSNPPFKITAEENQVMQTSAATFQLPVLLNFSIDITPDTFIGFLDPQIHVLEVYEMPYGHLLSAPITINNVIQGLSIDAQIDLIIVEGFVVYATIQTQLESILIPVNGFIENAETIDVSLTIDILLDFLFEKENISLPSATELNQFKRVDAFSLPNIASIFG